MRNLNITAWQKPGAAHERQVARAVARAAAVILGPLAQAYRARRDAEHLMSVNDYLLKDIGITRREIEAVIRRG
jgi:uncharacterized protein YjiS (DUF1127 family)